MQGAIKIRKGPTTFGVVVEGVVDLSLARQVPNELTLVTRVLQALSDGSNLRLAQRGESAGGKTSVLVGQA